MTTPEVKIRLTAEAAKFRQAIDKASKDYLAAMRGIATGSKQASADVSKLTATVSDQSGAIGRVTKRVLALGAAYISIQNATKALRAIVSTGADFERLGAQLETVMRSAAAGQEAFAWVREFAKTTPFQLNQVTESFIKLKAFGIDPTNGTMQAIVDQASALGGSQETLNGIILAVGQAWAKQKLQGEEILQLVERGVPVWELLSNAMGKNVQELQEMSSKGQLGRDAIALLVTEMGRLNDGASAKQMQTFNGLLSTLKDNLTEALNTIASSGALDAFKRELTALNEELAAMAEDGRLQEFAKSASEAIENAIAAVRAMIETLIEAKSALILLGEAIVGLKLAQFAKSLYTVARASAAAGAAAGGVSVLAGALRLLARAIPGLLAVEALLFVADKVVDALRLRNEALAAEEAAQAYLDKQQQIIDSTKVYADTAIKSADAVASLSKAESKRYREAVEGAKRYYEAQAALATANGSSTDPAVVAAKERAAAYAKSLSDLKSYAEQRKQAEADLANRVAEIKKQETAAIKEQIAEQLTIYDNAKRKLQSYRKEQESIAKEFADALKNLGKTDKNKEDLTYLDLSGAISQAQDAQKSGDFDKAIEKAREAKDIINELVESGKYEAPILRDELQIAADIANESAKSRADKQQSEMDKAAETITQLKADAEFLKAIEIGFDTDSAIASADDLRKRIQDQLAANPIEIPTVIVDKSAGKNLGRAGKILDETPKFATGGRVVGPGTGTSDSILARVSSGEYIVRAAAVQRYGTALLESINNQTLPGFAAGGHVGEAGSSTQTPVVINLPGAGSYRLQGSQSEVDKLARDLTLEAHKRGDIR